MATSIPPHNVAEVIDAATHLIDNPKAEDSALMDFVAGQDFPTGGVIVDGPEAIAHAYATGTGAFRVRAQWETAVQGRGTWTAVISAHTFQGQTGKPMGKNEPLSAVKQLQNPAHEIIKESEEDN